MRIKAHSDPSWAVMPAAESIILWLQKFLPAQAEDIRTRAREYYLQALEAGTFAENT